MAMRKIVLVGANGNLGPAILHSLLSDNAFTVTVLSRRSSKSVYPDSVHVTSISDDPSVEELTAALRGQDAVVVAFAGSISDLQIRLADAAAQAGVRRFIPADFGSCDSSSPRALDLIPLYRAKQDVRRHLQQLASGTSLTWTSLVCGHFFDYGLRSGLLQFDLNARTVRIFDGGDIRWSATTTETTASAVVEVLRNADETRNRMLYIQSFGTTQNEVLKSLERISGQSWEVEHSDSAAYMKDWKGKLDRDPDDADAKENLVSVLGLVDANWEHKDDFANSLLGLKGDEIDEVIKTIVS